MMQRRYLKEIRFSAINSAPLQYYLLAHPNWDCILSTKPLFDYVHPDLEQIPADYQNFVEAFC
ncbi:MAG: hypothetical protein B7Y15_04100 [Bacteroidetes bacterium 24-39-8]|nr:MAG: hypothetical protein B7Y15_04100 [Bacteroidetes bacterium 24-39-8]